MTAASGRGSVVSCLEKHNEVVHSSHHISFSKCITSADF